MRSYLIALALVAATAVPALAAATGKVPDVPATAVMEAAVPVASLTGCGVDVRAGPPEAGERSPKVAMRFD